MKYKEVKDALYSKGFKVENCQTGYILDIVGFGHPMINGEIFVSFDDKDEEEIQKRVNPDNLDEYDVDYENSKFLDDIDVLSVEFYIDKSFSFMSSNMIPTSGEDEENCVLLLSEDVDSHFHTVLNIITDKYFFIEFNELYYQKISEFNNKVKRFLPILDKYNFDLILCRDGGDNETLFANIQYIFKYEGCRFDDVAFFFEVLSWKVRGIISICSERFEFDMDCDLTVFETELKKQINLYDKVRNKVKEVYA